MSKPVIEAGIQLNRRLLGHASLFLAFLTLAIMAVVWPQWLTLEGTRSTLALQQGELEALDERIEMVRALNARLRHWQTDSRRVFLESELGAVEEFVRQTATQQGVLVSKYEFEPRRSPRWRSTTVTDDISDLVDADFEEDAGVIRPVAVRLSIQGSFQTVYSALSILTKQRRLFVIDRWQLRLTQDSHVIADVVATIFVIKVPDNVPAFPAPRKTVDRAEGRRTQG